jgi:pimeloyl-ACP methyl ester carboxylesterase
MQVRLASLNGVVVRPPGGDKAPPLLMFPGIGLGPWLFGRFQQTLAERGIPSIALELPGHGDGTNPSLDEAVDRVTEAIQKVPGATVLGHSFGGYLSQHAAARANPPALVLVNPLPHGGIALMPGRKMVAVSARYLPALVRRKPLRVSYEHYLACGLDRAPEADQKRLWELIQPWPAKIARDILRRRKPVEVGAIGCPVLVCVGKQDVVLPWLVSRRVGEFYDAITWRFDDVGHAPSWEDAGARLERDVAGWLLEPRRRKVSEVDAFAPNEGKGSAARKAAAGAAADQRSAYGQRKGREGERPDDRWDQNLDIRP